MRNAAPTVASMLVTAAYNMADTYFVSRLGTEAAGAVGIIFSLMAVIQACGFTVGQGAGSLTSRALGSGDARRAGTLCSTGIFLALALGAAMAALGTALCGRIVRWLGAIPEILPHALDYARFILLGAPFMVASFTMNNLLRFQGKAALSMVGLTAGGALNTLLDPLLIFGLDMGTTGAAVATMASQAVSFAILLSMFVRGKSTAELSPKLVSAKPRVYAEILTTGLPSLMRQGMGALSAAFLNRAAGAWGAAAVAGMSINSRVCMFLMAVGLGLGQGFQPVCGMNYGAGEIGRVREAYRFLVRASTAFFVVAAAAVAAAAPQIVAAFREDAAVVETGATAMRLACPVLPLHAMIFATNMLLQTTGQKKSAALLSGMRQGLYFLPLIVLLPPRLGILGVQLSQPLADLLTALTTVPFAVSFFRRNGAAAKK